MSTFKILAITIKLQQLKFYKLYEHKFHKNYTPKLQYKRMKYGAESSVKTTK